MAYFKPNSEEFLHLLNISIYTRFFSYQEERPFLVLLHGLRADTNRMLPLITILEEKYNVITLDQPGFGKSIACDSSQDYIEYCAELVAELLHQLKLPYDRTALVGTSHGANVIIKYLSNHPKHQFYKIGLVAPIFSYRFLSMSKPYKFFVYWIVKATAKGGAVCKFTQLIINSDTWFLRFAKLADKGSLRDKKIALYEMEQWRLMTLQHWGKSLADFLKTDLTTRKQAYNHKNVVFVYPEKDQYLDIHASVQGFKKLFPEAEFKTFKSDKHIPRGNFQENKEFMASIRAIVEMVG
ncbi:MAG: alpha/beta hydrolase [Candidatus Dojkabacteria bacterium]